MKITLLLFFLSFINAQIALPTFQAVHTPHSTTSGPVTVAVVSSDSYSSKVATAAQLNDDTYYDFTATALSVNEANESSELADYDVVIIGGSGHGGSGYTSTFYSALYTFMQSGGGILCASWFIHESSSEYNGGGEQATHVAAITPYEDDGSYSYMSGGTVTILSTGHDVTSGISNFLNTGNYVEYEDAIDSGAEKLGSASTNSSACTIVVHDHGSNGRTGYLGGMYMARSTYGNSSMRSGVEDRLLEQMVYWLAN
jgi:hypothetical protein